MPRIAKLSAHAVSDEIPTSPMADIAFLLIIFFMLTMTFAASRGLDFAVPQDPPNDLIETVEAVLIRVQPGGVLEVDGRAMASGEVLDYLAPKLRANPSKPVIVAPAPDATYSHFIAVYDLLRLAPERLGLEGPIHVALPAKGVMPDFR